MLWICRQFILWDDHLRIKSSEIEWLTVTDYCQVTIVGHQPWRYPKPWWHPVDLKPWSLAGAGSHSSTTTTRLRGAALLCKDCCIAALLQCPHHHGFLALERLICTLLLDFCGDLHDVTQWYMMIIFIIIWVTWDFVIEQQLLMTIFLAIFVIRIALLAYWLPMIAPRIQPRGSVPLNAWRTACWRKSGALRSWNWNSGRDLAA